MRKNLGYAIACAVLILGNMFVQLRGIVFFEPSEHVNIPASVRSSPGGYRSFHFWHSGFHGGK